jgi:hypothetical protein
MHERNGSEFPVGWGEGPPNLRPLLQNIIQKSRALPHVRAKAQGCRVPVRAGRVFEGLRFVPVRVKIRLRFIRFASCMSELGLHVTRVGIRVSHCFCVCLCVSCVSRVTRVVCHGSQKYCASCVSCMSGSVAVWLVSVSGSCVFAVRVCFVRPCKAASVPALLDPHG